MIRHPLPGPGLWPQEEPRHTESQAERRVYRALAAGLPSGWWAWHSMRLRSPVTGEHAEADFVLADPARPGLIILEVKGGQINQRNGLWFSYEEPLKRSPMDQALAFRRILVDCLRQKVVSFPFIAGAVCFPDCEFSVGPSQSDLADLVLGEQDLPYLAEKLPVLMEQAVPEPWAVERQWLRELHALWGQSWVPEMSLGDRVELDSRHRLRLDEEQARQLDAIQDNPRLLITGGAGTGKTMLAREGALRAAEAGSRVLLLCYTDALAYGLAAELDHSNITVAPVQRFALGLLQDCGNKFPANPGPDFWAEVSLRAASDAPPAEPWDTVVIDEGQDFSEGDWLLVEECLAQSGSLWVFTDNDQAFWVDRAVPASLMGSALRYRLNRPYRCPPAIQHVADCYAGRC